MGTGLGSNYVLYNLTANTYTSNYVGTFPAYSLSVIRSSDYAIERQLVKGSSGWYYSGYDLDTGGLIIFNYTSISNYSFSITSPYDSGDELTIVETIPYSSISSMGTSNLPSSTSSLVIRKNGVLYVGITSNNSYLVDPSINTKTLLDANTNLTAPTPPFSSFYGTSVTKAYPHDTYSCTLLPDQGKILYISQSSTSYGQIFMMDVDDLFTNSSAVIEIPMMTNSNSSTYSYVPFALFSKSPCFLFPGSTSWVYPRSAVNSYLCGVYGGIVLPQTVVKTTAEDLTLTYTIELVP
jgi:hypothetical protein